MVKNIVLQHKAERDKFLLRNYVLREKLDFAKGFLDSGLIKIITGPRRAGKSVFSFLLLKEKNFAYLNFDDENLLKIKNYDEILKAVFEVYPETKIILFDEIQNLENWELFVNKLQRRGFNLILTGSNANLLSKELGVTLTGRYITIEIFPFSFREYLKVNNFEMKKEALALPEARSKILNYLSDCLKSGGFPEVVVNKIDPKTYLETLFDAVLLRDVVKRYKVRFTQKLYDLAGYLTSNFSSLFSFTKIRNILGFNSTNTVEKYFRYLEESYLAFSLNRFSFKMKEQVKAPRKIYLIDNGFILAKSFQFSQNLGKLTENLAAVEILRRGYKLNNDVFYYKTANDYEIDNIQTKERELKGLFKASRELNCGNLEVITWDYEAEEEFKGKKINFFPLWKWLLEEK